MMERRITRIRYLLAVFLILGLSITETVVAQVEERQDAVGDVPIAADGTPEDPQVEEDGAVDNTIDAEIDTPSTTNETEALDTGETEDLEEVSGNGTSTGNNVSSNGILPETLPPTLPPTTTDGCFDNFNAVHYHISDDEMLFLPKKFVICPGTVLDIGFLVPGVGIEKGQTPFIPRSNTELLCGDDGSVGNNCIVRGGDFAVIGVPVFFRQDLTVSNVIIKGFIFEAQVQYSSFLAVPGDIVYEDCIFRDQQNFGLMVINYDPDLTLNRRLDEYDSDDPYSRAAEFVRDYRDDEIRRRKLKEEEEEEENELSLVPNSQQGGRDLQTESDLILAFTARRCSFLGIQQVERKLGVEFGIVSVKSSAQKITLEDCTFADNFYGNQEFAPIGYAILIQGTELQMHNVCFINNDFRGSGAVLLEQTANPFAPGANFLTNNYATEDDDLVCPFAAYFATDEDRKNSNFTCVPVQADTCGDEDVDADVESSNGVDATTSTALPSSSKLSLLSAAGLLCILLCC